MSDIPTLLTVMSRHVDRDDPAAGVHFWNTSSRSYDAVSYSDLVQRSFAFGQGLHDAGHAVGTVCLIACHSPYATLIAFYGAVSAGMIPMIFPMPKALGSNHALLERIHYWSGRFDKAPVLVLEQGLTERFHHEIPPALAVVRVGDSPLGDWRGEPEPVVGQQPAPGDIAFFQTTSSSTGDHKAVAISHDNILSNVTGIRRAVAMDETEKMISWLPLFHDMGLVGAVLFSFCHSYPLYLMTPTQFIKRPALWLKGMSEYGCTITTAPNFGYDYCSRLVSDQDAAQLDLTGAKHFFIGAEPIRVSTVRDFCTKFRPSGVCSEMIRPAYGLAESTIITTISDPERSTRFVFLDPDTVGLNQAVQILGESVLSDLEREGHSAQGHVAVCTAGKTIEGMRVELIDEVGMPVDTDRHAGEIVIQGRSVALGYVCGGEDLVEGFSGQRVRTGDMGIMVDGELFIIERIKNIIIRNGENFLVSALEERLADLLHVSHENVAVFESDIHDPSSPIVVLVEKHRGLAAEQIPTLLAHLPQEGFPIDLILFNRTRAIPRTTSGKKRHFYCRKLYQDDQLGFQQLVEVTPDKIAAASLAQAR